MSAEDPRKTALKRGLRQLTLEQIRQLSMYPPEAMALDDGNYVDGKFCPLAVGVGLHRLPVKDWTDDKVHAVLTILGYRVNNTRGVAGEFYTTDRVRDVETAVAEVLREKEGRS